MSRYHAGRMRACEYLPENGVCSTITLRTLYCIKLRVTFFVTRYLLRWYYRSNDFHNFHKPVYARGQSPRMQMASLSHGLQRELIVIRTSSLELIGASKRGGCTGCHKYSFEIDQLSEPKAFAFSTSLQWPTFSRWIPLFVLHRGDLPAHCEWVSAASVVPF